MSVHAGTALQHSLNCEVWSFVDSHDSSGREAKKNMDSTAFEGLQTKGSWFQLTAQSFGTHSTRLLPIQSCYKGMKAARTSPRNCAHKAAGSLRLSCCAYASDCCAASDPSCPSCGGLCAGRTAGHRWATLRHTVT